MTWGTSWGVGYSRVHALQPLHPAPPLAGVPSTPPLKTRYSSTENKDQNQMVSHLIINTLDLSQRDL